MGKLVHLFAEVFLHESMTIYVAFLDVLEVGVKCK